MITSKLTSKAQTTIPQPVRAALGLKAGDALVYEIDERRVILSKASSRQGARGTVPAGVETGGVATGTGFGFILKTVAESAAKGWAEGTRNILAGEALAPL